MTIHSVMALNAVARRPRPGNPNATPGPKRDAILRAAIDVFAERGYFNAQVADVARAAGVAAGTVYLYFKSKDDLLVSIFERTSPASDTTATWPSSFRWSCGSRPSSWS